MKYLCEEIDSKIDDLREFVTKMEIEEKHIPIEVNR